MGGFLSGRTSLTTVNTGDLADNAVTLAKMAGITAGNLIGGDSSGDPAYIATGTDGQVVTSGGAGVASAMETLSAGWTQMTPQATTSGTSFTFDGIPTGVNELIIQGKGVSLTTGNDYLDLQLGHVSAFITSGYLSKGILHEGSTDVDPGTDGAHFRIHYINTSQDADLIDFTVTCTRQNATGDLWLMNASSGVSSGDAHGTAMGSVTIGADLEQFKVFGGTFDAGEISAMYM